MLAEHLLRHLDGRFLCIVIKIPCGNDWLGRIGRRKRKDLRLLREDERRLLMGDWLVIGESWMHITLPHFYTI